MGAHRHREGRRNQFAGFSEFVVIGVETTGFDAERDRVVLVATIRSDLSEIIEHVPLRRISLKSTAIHGIGDACVQGKPAFAELAPSLRSLWETG